MPDIKVIFGCAAPWSVLSTDKAAEFLPVLEKHGVRDLDTAHIYWRSEEMLGVLKAPARFTMHTKAPGLTPGGLSRASIEKAMAQSLRELGVDSVETYFLHSPDPQTPISETMDAIQDLYTAGKFKKFGVSNFTATQLQELFDYAEPRNLVLPSVFEGNYSAITRHLERDIFPLIRKHGMSFYAYSPLAGGFLAKKPDAIRRAEGRWNPETRVGAMYQKMYNRPQLLEALDDWASIADEAGLTQAALAYRWIAGHSHLDAGRGDAVIVGASRPEQLDDTLTVLRAGPLDPKIVQKIRAVWEKVQDFAPVDNIQM